jgi:multiple sugar transport system substrate-binding protein
MLAAVVAAGCGGGGGFGQSANPGQPAPDAAQKQLEQPKQPPAPAKPVTITFYPQIVITDDDFQQIFYNPITKMYPNITPVLIKKGKGTMLNDLMAANDTPDVLITWNGRLLPYDSDGLLADMTADMQKEQIDLNRFEPTTIQAIKMASDKGEMYGLPWAVQFDALYYNKDIFDKYGVPYPKDGMTWDDTIELSKKVSRSEGATNYLGFDPQAMERLSYSYSLASVDAKTNKAIVNNESWRKIFELGKKIYDVPGNKPPKYFTGGNDLFMKDRVLAMMPAVNLIPRLQEMADQGNPMNWDLVQFPSFTDKPSVYENNTHLLAVTKTSKNRQAAIQALKAITSDEAQTVSSRKTARLTPLKNSQITAVFGADIPTLKGRHVEGIFKSKPGEPLLMSDYLADAQDILDKQFTEYMTGTDINTALRTADENINKMIDKDQAK